MQLIRELDPVRSGQTQALYKRGNDYLIVSTVSDIRTGNTINDTIIDLVGALDSGLAVSGEETMAFPASADGEITSWTELAIANGPGSRALVLSFLHLQEER